MCWESPQPADLLAQQYLGRDIRYCLRDENGEKSPAGKRQSGAQVCDVCGAEAASVQLGGAGRRAAGQL